MQKFLLSLIIIKINVLSELNTRPTNFLDIYSLFLTKRYFIRRMLQNILLDLLNGFTIIQVKQVYFL